MFVYLLVEYPQSRNARYPSMECGFTTYPTVFYNEQIYTAGPRTIGTKYKSKR